MGVISIHEVTPQAELGRKFLEELQEERRANSEYDAAIKSNDHEEIPENFAPINLAIHSPSKSSEERQEQRKSLVMVAAKAIIRRDVSSLGNTLGQSFVNNRIRYMRDLSIRRWQWLQKNAEFLFYQRALYLLSWYQKIFYYKKVFVSFGTYDAFLQEGHNTISYDNLKKLFNKLLISTTIDGVIQIDPFVKYINTEEYKHLNVFFVAVEKYSHREQLLSKEDRKLTNQDCKVLLDILTRQIANDCQPNHEIKISTIVNTFLQSYVSDGITTRREIAPEREARDEIVNQTNFMTEYLPKEAISSLKDCKAVADTFTKWLQENLETDVDIYFLYKSIKGFIRSTQVQCKKLLKEQKQSYETLTTYEDHLARISHTKYQDDVISSDIGNILLDDKEYLVINDLTNEKISLLKLAMLIYSNAREEKAIAKSFSCIELLIKGRYSNCFLPEKDINKFMFKNSNFSWKFLIIKLQNMLTLFPTTEKLRIDLLAYCSTSLVEINNLSWRIFHSKAKKSDRWIPVYRIICVLDDIKYCNDKNKIIEAIKKIYSNFDEMKMKNSRLIRIISVFINENQRSLIKSNHNIEMGNLNLDIKPVEDRIVEIQPISERKPAQHRDRRNTHRQPGGRIFGIADLKRLQKMDEEENPQPRP